MRSEKRVGAPALLWARGLTVLLGAAFVVAACGDDDSAKKAPPNAGGAGGDAAAGEPASGGSDVMTGGQPGEGGAGPSGLAGSAEAGATGMAGAGPEEGITLDQFCELQVRAREWLRECRNFGDASGWWGAQNIDQFCSSGRQAIEAGRLIYDPVQAAACAALSVGGCEDIEAFAFGVGEPQRGFLQSNVCEGVVTGTVALGDPCRADSTKYSSECAEGFCSKDACPGTCTAFSAIDGPCNGTTTACDPATSFCNAQNQCEALVPPIAVGADCDAQLDVCVAGAICYDGQCATEVPLGEACQSNQQCPDDAYCNETCQQRAPINGDCTNAECVETAACVNGTCRLWGQPGDDCPCDSGLWCDPDNNCQSPRPQGGDCSMVNAQCAAGLVCVPSGVDQTGPTGFECQPVGGDGDFCNPLYLGTCQVPLFCDPATFTCQAPGAENEPCNFAFPLDSCEVGLACSCTTGCAPAHEATATCLPRLADGADCMRSAQCLSGICTNQKCAPITLCL